MELSKTNMKKMDDPKRKNGGMTEWRNDGMVGWWKITPNPKRRNPKKKKEKKNGHKYIKSRQKLRIWGNFSPFCLLGFGVIFRCSSF